ncbi:branched-chain amino acid ABC transporter permease [Candidatus Woesearchaeota archaeon]|nr:branched-chain amino acid ABC transporter permease [Candidatus Woesearchaeota archaeon]MBI2130760.1 branched-chain amino acid ABC transporter permease [Candidatus Woesearchaeota archaeon]MBI2661563.1 branched-chain amino acid ABC transporter permease [Candidatus Woesearchaeota archaeon]
MIHEFFIQDFTWFFIYLIIVLSFNLAFGFTGMVNLGHMVSVGIGAYTSALLTLNGVPWYIALLAAGIIACVIGTIIAAITVRLKGDYFQIVTLGLIFIAIAVSRNWISLTRGALGLPGVPDIIRSNFYYMLFTMVLSLMALWFVYWLTNSETGKIFQAIRDDETATAILGKNTYFYKVLSLAISTFLAGIAGGLMVHQINFVDPSIFDLEQFIIILFMLIVGGLASIKGSILGVFLLFALIDLLRFLVVRPELIGPVRQMALLLILLLVLIYRPKGIFGKVDI